MSFFRNQLFKYKFTQATKNASEFIRHYAPFFEYIKIFTKQTDVYISQLPEWDLSNPLLVNYLGYIAGVIDSIEQNLLSRGKFKKNNELAVDIAFFIEAERIFKDIPGSKEFFSHCELALSHGGSVIGMLQNNENFINAQKKGGIDFMRYISQTPNYAPLGLFELKLFITKTN